MIKDEFTPLSVMRFMSEKREIIIIDEADSSNNIAKELALNGAPEGTAIAVKKQTQGRGRMGRSFISLSENGLYMSIILRPRISPDKCVDITVIGAVAVARAIERLCAKKCAIKWVNDIYIGEKKVCGILTEASIRDGLVDYAVIGIGVNIAPPDGGFDEEISHIACAMLEDTAPTDIKSRLLAEITDSFFEIYKELGTGSYMEEYRNRSNIIGKTVDVYRGDEIVSGVCVDIDKNANLVVKTDTGTRIFGSGDARVRKNEK